MIPYAKHHLDEDDIQAVCEALKSDFLTTGSAVHSFETALADFVGCAHAVAVSSGTAALHCAMYALGIAPGDEVIVPSMTFAATANCVAYMGATPVFADVDPHTLLMNHESVSDKITTHTKAIITVDYAGQTCDYEKLKSLAKRHSLALVADSCHALGATDRGQKAGSIADINIFSFHPAKHITTGEGGVATTNNPNFAKRMRTFRTHGIDVSAEERQQTGDWFYQMVDLGNNYRITDIQCALGISQLKKLPQFLERRRDIASTYDEAFSNANSITPLLTRKDVAHAYHLYVVRIDFENLGTTRKAVVTALRDKGIGTNVHYIPVHLHPYYKREHGTHEGMCPVAEKVYEEILSLPIFGTLPLDQVQYIANSLINIVQK